MRSLGLRSAVAIALAIAASTPDVALADPSSTTLEQGYELGEVQHPRVVGMAGATQVFGGSTTAIFVNPANLTLLRVYHLEGLAALSANRATHIAGRMNRIMFSLMSRSVATKMMGAMIGKIFASRASADNAAARALAPPDVADLEPGRRLGSER